MLFTLRNFSIFLLFICYTSNLHTDAFLYHYSLFSFNNIFQCSIFHAIVNFMDYSISISTSFLRNIQISNQFFSLFCSLHCIKLYIFMFQLFFFIFCYFLLLFISSYSLIHISLMIYMMLRLFGSLNSEANS